MKKNVLNWMLIAAMTCGLSLSLTACSDDDDENVTEQRNDDADPLDTDEARTAWRWINQLTDETEMTEGWKSKSYDVTLGQPSSQNELVRIVVVKSLDEAKKQFSLLADMDAGQLASKQTVNGGAAGTMTWTPSAEGAKNLAEVAVSSRIFPKLQKIVYCTEAQVGDNGILWDSMKGTAYYRYGDVIQDPEGYYWVCVRPAFRPDNKKSHWINIFNAAASGGNKAIPGNNLQDKWNNLAKYNNQTIVLPTKLTYDREKIHDAANFFWAMVNTEYYRNVCLRYPDGALGGFPYANHGENFLKAVADYWDEKIDGYTIWEKLFNCTREDMMKMKQMDFFYQGYSWTVGETGYLWRYVSKGYEPDYTGKESNDKEKFNFVTGGCDARYYAHTPGNDVKPAPFTNFTTDADGKKHGIWIIRYKTGAELMTSGSYSPYSQITSKTPGQHDVYRFNEKQNVSAGENVAPVEDGAIKPVSNKGAIARKGYLMCSDGYFYETQRKAQEANVTPVAIVVALSIDGVLEQGTEYNAIAMALSPINNKVWGAPGQNCGINYVTGTEEMVMGEGMNGIANTRKLASGCNQNHDHPAATACATYNSALTEATRTQQGFSQWFLPSVAQWQRILSELGMSTWTKTGNIMSAGGPSVVEQTFGFAQYSTPIYQTFSQARLWTSTPFDADNACTFKMQYYSSDGTALNASKGETATVYPCIAFKWNPQGL